MWAGGLFPSLSGDFPTADTRFHRFLRKFPTRRLTTKHFFHERHTRPFPNETSFLWDGREVLWVVSSVILDSLTNTAKKSYDGYSLTVTRNSAAPACLLGLRILPYSKDCARGLANAAIRRLARAAILSLANAAIRRAGNRHQPEASKRRHKEAGNRRHPAAKLNYFCIKF